MTICSKSFIIILGKCLFLMDGMIMKTGISTGCLYPMLTEKALELLLDSGFDTFEIFFNTFSELEPDYLSKLKNLITKYNANISSIHPFTSSFESYLLFSGYERRFEDGVGMYEMYYRCASFLGADKVVLHGMRDDFSSIGEDEYFRRFRVLHEKGRPYNVALLQENVDKYYSNRPAVTKEMKKILPDSSGFVLDIKQALRGGHDPNYIARIMGDKLKHVHISDITERGGCVLPGKGCFDYDHFFDTLKGIGYNGDIIIEVYRGCFDDVSELVKAKKFIEGFY